MQSRSDLRTVFHSSGVVRPFYVALAVDSEGLVRAAADVHEVPATA